jgi:sugar/nucleoside kinase (ribokinase family)
LFLCGIDVIVLPDQFRVSIALDGSSMTGTKVYDVIGLGNALVDILLELSEEEFATLHFEKGTMRLVEVEEQQHLLQAFHHREPRLVSGGSVANSIIAVSQLGGRAAFTACVGDDRYGLHYVEEFAELDIDFTHPPLVGETTGTCVSIITPDAERTMRTALGVSSHLSDRHVDEAKIAASRWLFIEGYVFANPNSGQHAIRKAVSIARQHGVRIAITCSEQFIPLAFREAFHQALDRADLLFCNAPEAMAVAGHARDAEEAFLALRNVVPHCVVTDGANGAYVRYGGEEGHVPAFPCEPKDLTGAGDMFAGAFLYGITHGVPPLRAARAANYLAMKVITQIGARLHHGTRHFWDEALAS